MSKSVLRKQFIVMVAGTGEKMGWTLGDFDTLREAYKKIEKRIPDEQFYIWDQVNDKEVS